MNFHPCHSLRLILGVLLSIVGCLSFLGSSQASEEGSVATDGRYIATKRSEFSPQEVLRNPFWPIGFTPKTGTVIVEEAPTMPTIDPSNFRLTATLLGVPPIAVIDGRDRARGEIFVKSIGGKDIQFRLLEVGDGTVVLEYRGGIVRLQNF